MTDNLGAGFCFTDQQLINVCNENPHFTDEDRFFRSFFPEPEMTNSEDDKLLISHITRSKVVAAPFSGKCAPAKVMDYRRDARELKEFDFANIHIKKRIELCRADDPALRVRNDGTFDDSEQSRFLTAQRQVAMKHRESVDLTEYKMMVDILFYGMTVIEGDDFPSYTVDLCRPESHTMDLTTEGNGFCDPCFDVFAWLKEQTRKMAAFGAVAPFDVVLGKDTATALAAHPQFRNWYEKCCQNYTPPSVGTLANRAPETFEMTELFAADSGGKWRFWVNCGTCCELETDPDTGVVSEVTREVMPADSILIVNRRALRSRRMFAPIRRLFKRGDMFAGIRKIASPFWLSTKVDEECDSIDMHMWSKPLPIVGCAAATVFAKVVTPECVAELCECPPLGMDPAVKPDPAPATTAKAATTTTAKKAE